MKKYNKTTTFKITFISLFILATALLTPAVYINFADRGYAEVIFLDVGQGDCCLVRTRQHDTILIDGGDDGTGKYTLIPFLRKKFENSIDAVFISHLHDDHVTGIYELIDEGFPIERIYVSAVASQGDDYSRLLSRTNLADIEVIPLQENDIVSYGEFTFDIIFSGDTSLNNENDTSMVMRMDCGKSSFLFTGDASSRIEERIIDNPDIDTDFLKVAHHGSASSTGNEFLQRVSPEISVISVGLNNKYNHPSAIVIDNLAQLNTPVFRTDKDGTVTFILTEDNILDIQTSRNRNEE